MHKRRVYLRTRRVDSRSSDFPSGRADSCKRVFPRRRGTECWNRTGLANMDPCTGSCTKSGCRWSYLYTQKFDDIKIYVDGIIVTYNIECGGEDGRMDPLRKFLVPILCKILILVVVFKSETLQIWSKCKQLKQ